MEGTLYVYMCRRRWRFLSKFGWRIHKQATVMQWCETCFLSHHPQFICLYLIVQAIGYPSIESREYFSLIGIFLSSNQLKFNHHFPLNLRRRRLLNPIIFISVI